MAEPIDYDDLEMLFPFLDESPSFAMGFECGKIYGQMLAKQPIVEALIHLKNWDQIKLVLTSAGYCIDNLQYVDSHFLGIRLVCKIKPSS